MDRPQFKFELIPKCSNLAPYVIPLKLRLKPLV
jgi:hypothetical protein